jgi:hypothetical protein
MIGAITSNRTEVVVPSFLPIENGRSPDIANQGNQPSRKTENTNRPITEKGAKGLFDFYLFGWIWRRADDGASLPANPTQS